MGPRNPTFGTFEGFLKKRSGPIASRLGGGREGGGIKDGGGDGW